MFLGSAQVKHTFPAGWEWKSLLCVCFVCELKVRACLPCVRQNNWTSRGGAPWAGLSLPLNAASFSWNNNTDAHQVGLEQVLRSKKYLILISNLLDLLLESRIKRSLCIEATHGDVFVSEIFLLSSDPTCKTLSGLNPGVKGENLQVFKCWVLDWNNFEAFAEGSSSSLSFISAFFNFLQYIWGEKSLIANLESTPKK